MRHQLFAAVVGFSLVCLAGRQASADLITNGGFESGNLNGWVSDGTFSSFTAVTATTPHTGTFDLQLGSTGSLGGEQQSIATTLGDTYQISFWLQLDNATPNNTPNEFVFKANGNTLLDEVNFPTHGYIQHTFLVTATGSSTNLEFLGRDDPAFLHLDDVSATLFQAAPPAPTDAAATPLPASIWGGLALMGGLGLTTLRRRFAGTSVA